MPAYGLNCPGWKTSQEYIMVNAVAVTTTTPVAGGIISFPATLDLNFNDIKFHLDGLFQRLGYPGLVQVVGFAPNDTYRPSLSFDDHSQLMRIVLADLVREHRPARTILVGFSLGASAGSRTAAGRSTSLPGLPSPQ